MNSRQPHFNNFYDDRVGAHRHIQSQERILNRFNEPAIIITAVVLLVACVARAYNLELSFDAILYTTSTYLWDFVVFIVPTQLIVILDNWLNPGSMSQSPPSTHAAKSEVMRRVMGLDRSGGMMESVFQARNRALSVTGSVLGLKLDPERPAGLGNRDNSCYQNSILQGLASLSSFPEYLSTCVRAIDMQQPTNDVAHTLRSLIADLNDTSNNGRTIWTPSLLKSMSTWTQQDAQEYFSKILDDIDRSVARAVKSMRRYSGLEADCSKDDSSTSQHSDDSGYQSLASSLELAAKKILRNPLEGLLAQRVACVQCGYSEGLSMIPFNCLTLSLGLDKNEHDLYERLDSYSKVEAIEGVECPKCTLVKARRLLGKLLGKLKESGSSPEQMEEPLRRLEAVELALEEDEFDDETVMEKCKISAQGKVNTTKTKQIVIARPPQSLAIHVNRSVFDPQTFDMIKNSAPVSFPLTLDLGPWCLGSAEDVEEKLASHEGFSEEQWLLGPKSSMIAGDLGTSRLTGPIYELRAAVTHYGRHENGHYICYRKYPDLTALKDQDSPAYGDTNQGCDAGRNAERKKCSPPPHRHNSGWWRLSDHNVSKVDEDVVMSLSPGVFMLFYECVDPSMILQSETDDMEDAQELPETANEANFEKGTEGITSAQVLPVEERDASDLPSLSSSASDTSLAETIDTNTNTMGGAGERVLSDA
ncbi:ubiquitin hydrolase [Metarhizium album ARSEF 1941]|uniref:ubiquitinyl hydrolase 1 n=1 Tax=Metarhizium album (strain ARSEF 1941) TaxID=1081103 RepID=A0A0B2WYQ2_METAS|nr:ubiquitin hydrolase [Metarhizium album ARSEF 1941]KHO01402.1 ubiquitin hydrolase [Metarhizium album ARSEF 1941]